MGHTPHTQGVTNRIFVVCTTLLIKNGKVLFKSVASHNLMHLTTNDPVNHIITSVFVLLCTHTLSLSHVYIHACKLAGLTCMHAYMHIRMHACTHAHTHTHTHTHLVLLQWQNAFMPKTLTELPH